MSRNINAFQGIGTFFSPNRVIFGCGAVSRVGEAARLLGGRALIITSPVINRLGLISGVRQSLLSTGIGVDVYEIDDGEPTTRMIDSCAAHVRQKGYDLLTTRKRSVQQNL